MKEKCTKWAGDSEITGFKGSESWLNGALKRHRLKIININGEADDLMAEEIVQVIVTWREELRDMIENKYVTASCVKISLLSLFHGGHNPTRS